MYNFNAFLLSLTQFIAGIVALFFLVCVLPLLAVSETIMVLNSNISLISVAFDFGKYSEHRFDTVGQKPSTIIWKFILGCAESYRMQELFLSGTVWNNCVRALIQGLAQYEMSNNNTRFPKLRPCIAPPFMQSFLAKNIMVTITSYEPTTVFCILINIGYQYHCQILHCHYFYSNSHLFIYFNWKLKLLIVFVWM